MCAVDVHPVYMRVAGTVHTMNVCGLDVCCRCVYFVYACSCYGTNIECVM